MIFFHISKKMNLKSGIDVIDIEIKSLQLLKKNLSKSFSDTVELLFKTKGKIIVSGIGKSGHVASKFHQHFRQLDLHHFLFIRQRQTMET